MVLLITFSKVCYCDIVPNNSHSVDKCIKIINLSDFPDISLVEYITGPTHNNPNIYLLNPKLCINKGYKFNRLQIFAVKKSYLVNKNLDSIKWLIDENCLHTNIEIESYGGYIDNTSLISSIEESYKIVGFTDTSIIIFKCKEIIKFNNGRPVSIKRYTYKDGISNLDKEINISQKTSSESNGIPSIYLDYLKALLLTIFIETIVLFLFFKTKLKSLKIQNKKIVLTGFLASFITLPLVWFVFPLYIKPTFFYILTSELSVTLIESFIILGILKVNYRIAIVISTVSNLTSFIFGLLISYII